MVESVGIIIRIRKPHHCICNQKLRKAKVTGRYFYLSNSHMLTGREEHVDISKLHALVNQLKMHHTQSH